MTTLQIVGIVCLVYMLVTLLIVGLRPARIWGIAKIQGFVSLLGENGARGFIGAWGLLVGGIGVYLLVAHGG